MKKIYYALTIMSKPTPFSNMVFRQRLATKRNSLRGLIKAGRCLGLADVEKVFRRGTQKAIYRVRHFRMGIKVLKR